MVIDGAAQVGQTLTADPSGISDINGLATPDYEYQWIRVNDDDSEADIPGADGINYMLVSADVGKRLEVKGGVHRRRLQCGDEDQRADGEGGRSGESLHPGNLWCATLNTVGGLGGYCRDVPGRCIPPFQDSFGSLSDDSFTLNGTPYLIKSLRWDTASAPGDTTGTSLHLTLDRDFPGAGLASLTLKVDVHEFVLSDAARGE